ncbi:NADP-dependent alcohol dehydrogenase [Sclerotinia borealis F-4128]|uniref:NADP-dependent alcohol dehydrogenase n=1 Tax=Sclerotinia borealis (strain F-4128) TaxID=1432307 RepID=W9CG08_SCLBF|nr:NADP-dependent alcohol dehydrogenase [Sclerotinia borealis F-4128]
MPTFTVFKGRPDGTPIKSTTTKPEELKGDSVLVKITASGVCGTDLHYKGADMVLGHEGVGIVEAVGPAAKYLKKGDRVGWGYEHDSCGHCNECLTGNEIFCPERALYGYANLDQGSFASHAIWREAFLFLTPASIPDKYAAPLQCGGATTFSALQGITSTDVVAVMGVGGLGHLAIQFAAKMGCRVVVLSSSDKKKDEAFKLGAHEYIVTSGAKELKVTKSINRLLVTSAVQPDWDLILPIMAPRATIYPLTVSFKNLEIPYMPFLTAGINIQGNLVANRSAHKQMLEFAAFHEIKPIVQTFPMTEAGIAEAMDKLDKGKVYYRAVLLAQIIEKVLPGATRTSTSSETTLRKRFTYKTWLISILSSCSPKSKKEKKIVEKK